MTPLQFAHAECPNYKEGRCLGMRIADDLSPLIGKPRERCNIDVESCDYFEECVAPMRHYVTDEKKQKSYLYAMFLYKESLKKRKVVSTPPIH